MTTDVMNAAVAKTPHRSPEYQAYLSALRRRTIYVKAWQVAIVLAFLIFWQIAPQYGWVNPMLTSYPTAVVKTMLDFTANGSLLYHTWSTVFSTIVGFVGSMVIGGAFALAFWSLPGFYRVMDPYMVILNALPKVALVPIFYIWLGDNASIYAMAIIVGVFITILMLYTGFCSVDPDKIRLVQLYGASHWNIIVKVLLPGTVPMMMSTLKVNVGLALVGVVVGEFQTGKSGLGYLITYGSQIFQMNLVMTAIVILGAISAILFAMIQMLETALVRRA